MTQDEIIRFAIQCRLVTTGNRDGLYMDALTEFAKLVAAKALAQTEQEPVAWGVDWGKAGDIPCVSIVKRLPDGGIKVLAVEYAPYSYTTSPKLEQDDGICTACENNLCTAKQGCVALDNPPQRTWVGLTNNDLQPIAEEYRILFGSWVHDFARAIEAKLKEKNT